MTAPDPTAGERECRYPCDCGQFHDEHCACMDGHAPPAVAASTGTSEDVEALARALCDVGIERGYVGADAIRKHWAEQLLASDWLAAREAAARAEERERIAQTLDLHRARYVDSVDASLARGWRGGMENAARIAREAGQ